MELKEKRFFSFLEQSKLLKQILVIGKEFVFPLTLFYFNNFLSLCLHMKKKRVIYILSDALKLNGH